MEVEKQYKIIKLNFFEMGEPKDIIVIDNFNDFIKIGNDNNMDFFYELDGYYLFIFQGILYKHKIISNLKNNDMSLFISDVKELFCGLTEIFTLFRDGKMYKISMANLLEKSFRWKQKEGTEVRSFSIHEYERINA